MRLKKNQYEVIFTRDDACEIYHIINSRGFSSTRAKLLNALGHLDKDLARRVYEQDEKAMQHNMEAAQ